MIVDFHHSPSNLVESEGQSEVFGLSAWEGFGKCVGDHVFGRAVVNNNLPGFYDVTDEMETGVNVFGAGVKLVVVSESDSGLRVGVK
jgi:hypothetical protein